MVHTVAGGEREDPTDERVRYSWARERTQSPELGIGQMKLEAPGKYNGAKKPGVGKWIHAMTTWMSLMRYPERQWVLIAST